MKSQEEFYHKLYSKKKTFQQKRSEKKEKRPERVPGCFYVDPSNSTSLFLLQCDQQKKNPRCCFFLIQSQLGRSLASYRVIIQVFVFFLISIKFIHPVFSNETLTKKETFKDFLKSKENFHFFDDENSKLLPIKSKNIYDGSGETAGINSTNNIEHKVINTKVFKKKKLKKIIPSNLNKKSDEKHFETNIKSENVNFNNDNNENKRSINIKLFDNIESKRRHKNSFISSDYMRITNDKKQQNDIKKIIKVNLKKEGGKKDEIDEIKKNNSNGWNVTKTKKLLMFNKNKLLKGKTHKRNFTRQFSTSKKKNYDREKQFFLKKLKKSLMSSFEENKSGRKRAISTIAITTRLIPNTKLKKENFQSSFSVPNQLNKKLFLKKRYNKKTSEVGKPLNGTSCSLFCSNISDTRLKASKSEKYTKESQKSDYLSIFSNNFENFLNKKYKRSVKVSHDIFHQKNTFEANARIQNMSENKKFVNFLVGKKQNKQNKRNVQQYNEGNNANEFQNFHNENSINDANIHSNNKKFQNSYQQGNTTQLVILPLGLEAELTCPFHVSPPEVLISWYHSRKPLSSNGYSRGEHGYNQYSENKWESDDDEKRHDGHEDKNEDYYYQKEYQNDVSGWMNKNDPSEKYISHSVQKEKTSASKQRDTYKHIYAVSKDYRKFTDNISIHFDNDIIKKRDTTAIKDSNYDGMNILTTNLTIKNKKPAESSDQNVYNVLHNYLSHISDNKDNKTNKIFRASPLSKPLSSSSASNTSLLKSTVSYSAFQVALPTLPLNDNFIGKKLSHQSKEHSKQNIRFLKNVLSKDIDEKNNKSIWTSSTQLRKVREPFHQHKIVSLHRSKRRRKYIGSKFINKHVRKKRKFVNRKKQKTPVKDHLKENLKLTETESTNETTAQNTTENLSDKNLYSKIETLEGNVAATKSGKLVFKNGVLMENEGIYECRTVSAFKQQESFRFQVVVKEIPQFLIRPQAFYQKMKGDMINFPCQSAPHLNARISWRKLDGGMPPINRTLFEKNGNFIIAKLTPQDAGTYECVAFNSVAYITAKTVLYVETTKVHGPIIVFLKTGSSTASLSWKPSFHHLYSPACHHYLLWYRRSPVQEKPNYTHYYYDPSRIIKQNLTHNTSDWFTIAITNHTTLYSCFDSDLNENNENGYFNEEHNYDLNYSHKSAQNPLPPTFITIYHLNASTNYDFIVMSRDRDGVAYFSEIMEAKTSKSRSKINPFGTEAPPPLRPTTPPSPSINLYSLFRQRVTWRKPASPKNISVALEKGDLVLRWNNPPNLILFRRKLKPPVALISQHPNITSLPHQTTQPSNFGQNNVSSSFSKALPNLNPSKVTPIKHVKATSCAIEYKTYGRWVKLAHDIPANITHFRWTTVSKGTRYNFRIRCLYRLKPADIKQIMESYVSTPSSSLLLSSLSPTLPTTASFFTEDSFDIRGRFSLMAVFSTEVPKPVPVILISNTIVGIVIVVVIALICFLSSLPVIFKYFQQKRNQRSTNTRIFTSENCGNNHQSKHGLFAFLTRPPNKKEQECASESNLLEFKSMLNVTKTSVAGKEESSNFKQSISPIMSELIEIEACV